MTDDQSNQPDLRALHRVATNRTALLKQLRRTSPADLRSALIDQGTPSEEIDQLFATLPVRRIGMAYRVVVGIVLFAWVLTVLTQVVNVITPSDMNVLIKSVVGTALSCTFFVGVKRLVPQSFGFGMIWLAWIIAVSLSEFDTLSVEEYSDPFVVGALWVFIAILVAGVVGMGVLKHRLYPGTPWLHLRPLRP